MRTATRFLALLIPLSSSLAASASAQTAARSPDAATGAAFAAYRSDRDGSRVALTLPSNGTFGEVTSLGAAAQSTGPLFTPVTARLVVTASAYLYNADPNARSFQCVVQVRPHGGAAQSVSFLSHDSLARAENRTVTLTGGAVVTPGTYDVALLCATGLANTGGKVFAADLTAMAVPQ